MHGIGQLSLIAGPVPVLLALSGAGALLGLLLRRDRRHLTRTAPVLVVLAVLAALGVRHLVEDVWVPFPDALPGIVYAWLGAAVLAVLLLGPRLWHARSWWRRGLAVLAVVAVVVAGASQVNLAFLAYPTVSAALGDVPGTSVPFTAVRGAERTAVGGTPLVRHWTAPADLPAHGELTQVDVAPTVSGFSARPAEVYLPPAYLSSPRALLPVLVLLAGQPGSPGDWPALGGLATVLDTWAAAHHGLAPVVVMADGTGSELGNPLCVDSVLGHADTYLAVDVPRWISTHLQVDPDHAHWAVGGLSYGGTCSLQLALRHPAVYPTFLDLSGQSEPTLGSRARTVDTAFGGSTAAFTAVTPLDLMASHRYPQLAGSFVVGAQDEEYRPQAVRVVAAARAAGIAVRFAELPGSHDWGVWRQGLADNLNWLGVRTGLLP